MLQEIKTLVQTLNEQRDAYYNKDSPKMTDKEYDRLFDRLEELEKKSGIIFSNSPTQSVGYYPVSELAKVRHTRALLSLEKTKQIRELADFMENQDTLLMLKLDGLTVKLVYEEGRLVQASTRGDGNVGEDITHNIPAFENVPLSISYRERLVTTGEAFIYKDDFRQFSNVYVHMQTYAAYLYLAKELKLSTYPKVLMIDIGGYTLDYMLLEKGMILWNYTDSTGKGVISMYQRVNKGIREKFDLDLKENDIDSVLKEESCMYGEAIRKRVVEIVTEHVEEILGMFRECGIDLRSAMTIFVGGGSILLSKIIETVWKRYDGEYYVVNDSKVNVHGYRKKYLFDKKMQ